MRRRVFKTRSFARWSRNAAVPDRTLCAAVEEIAAGLVDAHLGGSLLKKRVSLPGRGKRAGALVLIATRMQEHWFFLYGFAKNARATIDDRELAALQKTAEALLEMDLVALGRALRARELSEICDEEEPHTG